MSDKLSCSGLPLKLPTSHKEVILDVGLDRWCCAHERQRRVS